VLAVRPSASVAVTANANVPAAVGVPTSVPVASTLNPGGARPVPIVHE
jgi:hypothetical protein